MNPEDGLNDILDEIQARMAVVFELDADRIYEYRDTGEQSGESAYFAATIVQTSPIGLCALNALVECTIGFHKVDDGTPRRKQRLAWAMAMQNRLTWAPGSTDAIAGVKLPEIGDMAVSENGDPDQGHLMGGLTYRFQTVIQKTPVV
jgi:hypothetical protein